MNERLPTKKRKKQISEAVLRYISEEGSEDLTMSKIARRVGIVPSAIYRHFESKKEMIESAVDLFRDRINGTLKKAKSNSENAVEYLEILFDLHTGMIKNQEMVAIPRIAFSESMTEPGRDIRDKLFKTVMKFINDIEKIIGKGIKNNLLKEDLDSSSAASLFIAILQHSLIIKHLSRGSVDIAEYREKIWRFYLDSIIG